MTVTMKRNTSRPIKKIRPQTFFLQYLWYPYQFLKRSPDTLVLYETNLNSSIANNEFFVPVYVSLVEKILE